MARILITGGSSYLGRHLTPLAAADHDVFYTTFLHDPFENTRGFKLDVRDRDAVFNLLQELDPEVIIHTVGSNRVDDMTAVITSGTANVSQAAQVLGARLIHISTDVVFDGRDPPYEEARPTSPLHAYGRAKAEAEQAARQVSDHVIIRTSLIYGLRIMDQGTSWVVSALQSGKPVTLFTDQKRNPVWAETLSRACLELATNSYTGVLNVAGGQILSRAEFGLRMLDWWGIKERKTLQFGRSDSQRWPVDCTLSLTRAKSLLTTPLPGVDEVLKMNRSALNF